MSAGATAAHLQAQGAFEPGPSPDVEGADEPAVPAISARTATEPAPAEARALAKPPVRKLAKDLGVDITTLTPTGPKGTVTREDVEQRRSRLRRFRGSGARAPSHLNHRWNR